MKPSVKTLKAAFPDENAHRLRDIMDGKINPEVYPSVQDWIRQCWNRPHAIELVMAALNEEIGGCGVEAIYDRNKRVIAEYVNTGDSYSPTILLTATGNFRVTTWGDFVEGYERRHGKLD